MLVGQSHCTISLYTNLLAHGATATEILQEYKGLVAKDIQACLLFAAQSLESTFFVPLAVDMEMA